MTNKGRLIMGKEGYEYISESGITYSLYEGTSIGADSTSDMVFIMNDKYPEYDEYNKLYVGWFFGASFPDWADMNDVLDIIYTQVSQYEDENQDIINEIKHDNGL